MPRTRSPYPEQFRREAVELAKKSGRPMREIAKDLGVTEQSLRNWVKQTEVDAGRAHGVSSEEKVELRRLRRENWILREEREILRKSRGLLRHRERADPVAAFWFIAAEKANHKVATMCRVLGVSRAGFYAWERRAPCDRALSDAWLTERIRVIHKKSRGTYGSRRIHAELRLEHGIRVGKKRVERLMALAGLSGCLPRPRKRTTIRVEGVRDGARPGRARLQPRGAGPSVVGGYHLHLDAGGLAVPRRTWRICSAGRSSAGRCRITCARSW